MARSRLEKYGLAQLWLDRDMQNMGYKKFVIFFLVGMAFESLNAWGPKCSVEEVACIWPIWHQSVMVHALSRPCLQPSLLDALSTLYIHVNLSTNICFGIAFKLSGIGIGLGSLWWSLMDPK